MSINTTNIPEQIRALKRRVREQCPDVTERFREVEALVAELRAVPGLADLAPKYSESAHQPFTRMLVRIKKEKAKDIQVAFLAIDKKGTVGSFSIHPGFSYALRTADQEKLVVAKSYFK